MSDLLKKYKRLIRFAVVGVINTGVDVLLFTVLREFFGLHRSICQVVGYTAGTLNSFAMNKLWTFENKEAGRKTVGQAIRFITVNAVSLGASLLVLELLNKELAINIYGAKGAATAVSWAINYAGYRLWVFQAD